MSGAAALASLCLATALSGTPSELRAATLDLQLLEASNQPFAGDGAPFPSSRAARDLGSTLNYKFYRTLSAERRTLRLTEASTLELPNHTQVTLTWVAIDPDGRWLRLRLQTDLDGTDGPRGLDAEYSVRRGATVFVSAGASGPEAVLVLAITAQAGGG